MTELKGFKSHDRGIENVITQKNVKLNEPNVDGEYTNSTIQQYPVQ